MNRYNKKRKQRLAIISGALFVCAMAAAGTMLGKTMHNRFRKTVGENTSEEKANVTSKSKPAQGSVVNTGEASWNLMLVNPWNKMEENLSIELTQLANGHAIDKRAYPDLQNMMDDARAEGLSPIICSSYRTSEKQRTLFDNETKRYLAKGYSKEDAEKEAAKWVAVPGTSEHQTGLAVDIVAKSYQMLDKKQEETPEQQWLMANSYKYGFILRYPTDKSDVTGINYEPWHYRYVGKEAAKEMFEQGICLEEYLDLGLGE